MHSLDFGKGKPDNNKEGRLTVHRESDTLIVLGERESRLQGEGAYMARNMQRNKVPRERRLSP